MNPSQGNRPPEPMFYVYGKRETQTHFRPMDLSKGVRVMNLIFATRLNVESKDKFLTSDAKANPDWQFEARPIPNRGQQR